MADDFRRMQRKDANDASPNHRGGHYGCSCCRPISNLNHFKKFARKQARHLLKQEDKSTIEKELSNEG